VTNIAAPATKSPSGFTTCASALCLAVTLGSGLYGTGFWLTRDSGPTRLQHEKACSALRTDFVDKDLIILVPHYATMAREFLGDLHPVATRRPLNLDWSAHRRVWVYGLFGSAGELRPEIEAAGHRHQKRLVDEDGITVDLYEVHEPATIVFSFRDQLKKARVYHEIKPGQIERCDKWMDKNGQGGADYGRWSCKKDAEWFYVSPEWHRMGDHLELCLWAHPPNMGRLVIEYPSVPMTGQLLGVAGHTLNGSLHARAAIDLTVSVSGQASQSFGFDLNEHYRRFALTTPVTGTATVSFAVSTPDAGANHFCFTAEMRK
jgi:hypothetical protein